MTNITTASPKIARQLQAIVAKESDTIRAYVAQTALRYGSYGPAQMFADLSNCGCQCGTIGSLIYYQDTHAFFDRFYDEIEEMREQYEDELGEPLHIKGDLKNWFAWFAFEEAAFRMAHDDLGLEL